MVHAIAQAMLMLNVPVPAIWAKTIFQSGFEGVNGQTSQFLDDTGNHTLTPVQGASLQSGVKEYGATSAFVSGTGGSMATNVNPRFALTSAALNDPFLIEFTVYVVNAGTYDLMTINAPPSGSTMLWMRIESTGNIRFLLSKTGSGFGIDYTTVGDTYRAGLKKYCVEKNNAGILRIYSDNGAGQMVQRLKVTPPDWAMNVRSDFNLQILGGFNTPQNVYMDSVRFAKDCPYDSDAGYPAPTGPFAFYPKTGGAILDQVETLTGAWWFDRALLTSFSGARHTDSLGAIVSFVDQTTRGNVFTDNATVANRPALSTAGPNNIPCADFNGVANILANSPIRMLFGMSGLNYIHSWYMCWAFVIDTITTNNATPNLNEPIAAASDGNLGMFIRNTGTPATAQAYHYAFGGYTAQTTGIVAGQAHVVEAWKNADNTAFICIDNGTPVAASGSNSMDNIAGLLQLGRGNGSKYFDGKIFGGYTAARVPSNRATVAAALLNIIKGSTLPPQISTSWFDPLSDGDRRALITMSTTANTFAQPINNLIDGTSSTNLYWDNGGTNWNVKLDFGVGATVVIDALGWLQHAGTPQGQWCFGGSNDGVNYTTFPLLAGGTAFELISNGQSLTFQAFVNTTAYRHYMLQQVGGVTSAAPYLLELYLRATSSPLVIRDPLEKGDRTSLITVTTNAASVGGTTVDNLIDGGYRASNYVDGFRFVLDQTLRFIKFDLRAPKIMTDIILLQNGGVSQGTWIMEASPDDIVPYTQLASFPTFGSLAICKYNLSNSLPYRFYQLRQISGVTTDLPLMHELEFKFA